ncbi:hypothetical protein D3C80_589320 [compost metagenome]
MLTKTFDMFRFDTHALRTRIGPRFHDDILFDDHVSRTTDKQQMFNIIAADQNQLAAAIHRCCIHNRKSWLTSCSTVRGKSSTAEATNNT